MPLPAAFLLLQGIPLLPFLTLPVPLPRITRAPWQCWASHQHPFFHQEGQPSYNLQLQQGSSLQLAILVVSFMKPLSGSSLFQRPQSSAWLLCPCQLFLMSSLAVPIPRLQVSPSGYAPFSFLERGPHPGSLCSVITRSSHRTQPPKSCHQGSLICPRQEVRTPPSHLTTCPLWDAYRCCFYVYRHEPLINAQALRFPEAGTLWYAYH